MSKPTTTPPICAARQSNIELLRCVSMFMVLMMHTSFITFGFPTVEETRNEPLFWGLQTLQYSVALVAVNVFVMISGWFSIKPKAKGITSFTFQVAFLKLLSFCFFVIAGLLALNKTSIADLLMLKPYTGWFIKTYILLYILSPVLNAFVENTNRQVYKRVLFFYFVFIFLLGWFKDITGYMMGGYSISMFVGLYLLARYVRVYSPSWSKFSKKKDLAIYLLVTAVTFLGIYIPVYFGLPHSETFVQAFTRYSSPFVVLGALFLLLMFSKIKIGVIPWLNNVAKSCFAVYLLHFMWGLLPKIVIRLYDSNSMPMFYIQLIGLLLVIFFSCILIDRVRIEIWNKISSKLFCKY